MVSLAQSSRTEQGRPGFALIFDMILEYVCEVKNGTCAWDDMGEWNDMSNEMNVEKVNNEKRCDFA